MSDAAVAQPAEAAPAATETAVPDDLPSLEEATPDAGDESEGRAAQSRAEKKIRKALSKFGLTPVKGVYRVTVKKPQSVMFVISNPDVFKSPTSESYVIYGEAKMEDTALSRFQDAAKGLNIPSSLPAEAVAAASAAASSTPAAAAPAAAPAPADGVAETDITLVMSQTGTSRENAIAVLKKHNGDLINSIMELTSVVQG